MHTKITETTEKAHKATGDSKVTIKHVVKNEPIRRPE